MTLRTVTPSGGAFAISITSPMAMRAGGSPMPSRPKNGCKKPPVML